MHRFGPWLRAGPSWPNPKALRVEWQYDASCLARYIARAPGIAIGTAYMAFRINVQSLPEILASAYHASEKTRKHGALPAQRGIFYQYLYAFKLMESVLASRREPLELGKSSDQGPDKVRPYDAFAVEWYEDFTAWSISSHKQVSEFLLVQVKSSAAGRCLLRGSSIDAIMGGFSQTIKRIRNDLPRPPPPMRCRLVYSPCAL